jgi:tripartite-type tricarboxylate transporter receptor subunit TctC
MQRALRWFVVTAMLPLLQIAQTGIAGAQSYPTRSVTMVVPYPAGGPTDTLARVMADPLKAALGQSVILENITGAGGSIATGRVAHATPDGYTIEIGHNQTHVINGATQNLNYDVVKDFAPITLIAATPIWLIAKPAVPATNLKEFIAWLKKQDGKATMGSVGVGGPGDIAAASFKSQTGTKFAFVPYRGGAPLLQDMLGGQIDFTFGQAPTYLPYVRNGQLKAFAVLMPQRWYAAPDVPTLDELGIKGIYASFWHGIWAPKGTPKPIVEKLNAAFVQTLADQGVQQRFKDIGQEIFPRGQQNPAALAEQQKVEIERWWPVIKAAGIKSE